MPKKGYWIVCHISDADAAVMSEYAQAARPVIEAAGGKLIVRGKPARACEGAVNEPTIVVEFENLDTALAVYDSPGYQAAVKIIEGKVKRDFRIIEGV